jgi:hypothetical protein
MKNLSKILLMIVSLTIIVSMIQPASAFLCYQESANVSNQSGTDNCVGLNYGGRYTFSNQSGIITFTYKLPNYILDTVIWQIKWLEGTGSDEEPYVMKLFNITVPSQCIMNNQINFSMYQNYDPKINQANCRNATAYQNLMNYDPGTGAAKGDSINALPLLIMDGNWNTGNIFVGYWYPWYAYDYRVGIFEEGIFWNASSIIENITLYDEQTGAKLTQVADVTFTNLNIVNITTYSINESAVKNISLGNYTVYINSSGTKNYDSRYYTLTQSQMFNGSLNFYLSSNASQVLFTLRDSGSAMPIEGANIIMYRFIGGDWTTVESKFSDVTGKAMFNYYPNNHYQFYISATGYNNNLYDLDPISFSNYVVLMVRNSTPVSAPSVAASDVSLFWTPHQYVYNIAGNFTWLITSPKGYLTSYGFTLNYCTNTTSFNGSNTYGQMNVSYYKVTCASYINNVNLTMFYTTTQGQTYNFSYNYAIEGIAGNYTISANRDQTYGLGLFERIIIFTLLLLVLAGAAYAFGGTLGSTLVGLLIIGWFYLGMHFIPLYVALLPAVLLIIMLMSGRQ